MSERGLKGVRFITPTCLSYGSQDETPDLDAVGALRPLKRYVSDDAIIIGAQSGSDRSSRQPSAGTPSASPRPRRATRTASPFAASAGA
jgi:hypothetical protein